MSTPVGSTPDAEARGGPSTGGSSGEVEPDEEIRRLREEVSRLRARTPLEERTRYRRLGAALAVIGVGTIVAGWYLVASREVLFALGGTGLIGAFLLFYLNPGQLVPAEAGEFVYTSLAANQAALVEELGLQDEAVYVPRTNGPGAAVSLFVPLHPDYRLPDEESLASLLVLTDEPESRGVSLHPSGGDLLGDFVDRRSRRLRSEPEPLVEQLTDGLRDTFGVVESVTASVDAANGRANVAVAGGAYGPVDRFDNPVSSFLAAGLSRGLGTPITVEVDLASGSAYDHVVTCRWAPNRPDGQS